MSNEKKSTLGILLVAVAFVGAPARAEAPLPHTCPLCPHSGTFNSLGVSTGRFNTLAAVTVQDMLRDQAPYDRSGVVAPDVQRSEDDPDGGGQHRLVAVVDESAEDIRPVAPRHSRPPDRVGPPLGSEEHDFVFLIDVSGSVGGSVELQRDAVIACICGEDAVVKHDGTMAVAVIEFATGAGLDVELQIVDSVATANDICDDIEGVSGDIEGFLGPITTRLEPALDLASNIFSAYPAVPNKHLFLSTDAMVTDAAASEIVCEDLRKMAPVPVQICTALVGQGCLENDLLENCANTVDSDTYNPIQPTGFYQCLGSVAAYEQLCTCCASTQTTPDCDGNFIMDACDIIRCSDPSCNDCNGNGIMDGCDIAACFGSFFCTDCNCNGIPDGCDIDPTDPDGDGQSSDDCQANLIPDECESGACCDTASGCTDVPVECCTVPTFEWLEGVTCDIMTSDCEATGACCHDEGCSVITEGECNTLARSYQGDATNCSPNCCALDVPTGSDCACETSVCVVTADSSLSNTICSSDDDCGVGETCLIQCTPAGVTQLRHPFRCIDDLNSPLEPEQVCDPANGNADCPAIPCTSLADCPLGTFSCLPNGFCEDTENMTCGQSFTGTYSVARKDTILDGAFLFTASNGDLCSLNTGFGRVGEQRQHKPQAFGSCATGSPVAGEDRVGWYELIDLPDLTPGEVSDDCFVLTVGLCCSVPFLTPVWPFLSSFKKCPCVEPADVIAQAPDFDISGNSLDGFGPFSNASIAGRCEDGNYSATFTVAPGEYAYQVHASTTCAGLGIACDDDDDCPFLSLCERNPDYSVVFTTESCQIGACCVNSTCILTHELGCRAQDGIFLGGGAMPVVSCQAAPCGLGACCVDGTCKDDQNHDQFQECDPQGGVFLGGVDCASSTCPGCPYDSAENCQQVQTIFGAVPLMDRNPLNGSSGGAFATVLADDVKFGGSIVDEICWSTAFFLTPCCDSGKCAPLIDATWEIRIYGPDPNCDALPGAEIGWSTITARYKVEGTGQATATWHYSGSLDSPIALPNGGFAGDTYWFEVSAFGSPGCEVRAIWSRDDGNEHYVASPIDAETGARAYDIDGIGGVDVGFCEDSGILKPGDVFGSCCICPANCQENLTARECDTIRGVWLACATCAESPCPGPPENDNCFTPFVVSNVPTSPEGNVFITISNQNNICATDEGPGLSDDPNTGGCSGSLGGGADMHNDVWYSFHADACGDLRITGCGGSDQDQIIAVYDASGGCPLTDANELTCGDDNCGIVGGASDVTVRVFGGQDYLIRVGGWNDEVPGRFNGDPRGSFDLQWSLAAPCPPLDPPVRASAPHDILKNRYISIDPRGAIAVNPSSLHIRVTLVSTQVNGHTGDGPWWAGQPDTDCISVVTTTKPASEPDWTACNTAHLTGCPIIPTTTYALATESAGALSAEVFLDTQAKPFSKWYGDCVGFFDGVKWTAPNGTVNISDAHAAIKTFQFPGTFAGTHVSVTDLDPSMSGQQINLVVNIADVFAFILGFQGAEFQGSDLTLCP